MLGLLSLPVAGQETQTLPQYPAPRVVDDLKKSVDELKRGTAALKAYEQGDYATAHKEWLALAQGGDAFAQYALGGMYQHGQGVPQDYKEAVKWYRLAAEHGNVFSCVCQLDLAHFDTLIWPPSNADGSPGSLRCW